jgi:hypothetical protein
LLRLVTGAHRAGKQGRLARGACYDEAALIDFAVPAP